MTLDHKSNHKGMFFEIEFYTTSESWTNKLSIDVSLGYDNIRLIYNYLKIWTIVFKVVQIKFLAYYAHMHITNKKIYFDIFKEGYLQNIFMEHDI